MFILLNICVALYASLNLWVKFSDGWVGFLSFFFFAPMGNGRKFIFYFFAPRPDPGSSGAKEFNRGLDYKFITRMSESKILR